MCKRNMANSKLSAGNEHYRYRNVALCQVASPHVLSKILKCAVPPKQDHETYHVYLKRKGLSNTAIKNHFRDRKELEKIKTECTSDSFDVTALVPLIQVSCPGLAPREDAIWKNSTDTSRVESLIHQVRELRNEVVHRVTGAAIKEDTFKKVREKLELLIDVSGAFFGWSQIDIDDEKLSLLKITEDIDRGKYERHVSVCKIIFEEKSREENLKFWSNYGDKTVIPFSGKVVEGDVFHSLDFTSVMQAQIGSSATSRQPYGAALDQCLRKDDTPITIIIGEPGSGKTTALKAIAKQFLSLVPKTMKVLEEDTFDALYYYECRATANDNFINFVETNFPETCLKIGRDNIKPVFLHMTNLTLIDGYDECNTSSTVFLDEMLDLLSKAKETNRCIVTTRPHTLSSLKKMLNDKALRYAECKILDISDIKDQTEFLLKYENSSISAPDLSKTFASLTSAVRGYFTSPIRLVWFVYLFCAYKGEVTTWKTEYDVLTNIWKYYHDTVSNKLQAIPTSTKRKFVDKILMAVGNSAFRCLADNSVALTEARYSPVVKACNRIIRRYKIEASVGARNILSSIYLTSESRYGMQYSFPYKSIQEMFATKSLIEALEENPDLSVEDTMKQLADVTQEDLLDKYVSICELCLQ